MPSKSTQTPRWVKLSAIAGGVVVLLVVAMLALGHGPGRHFRHLGATPAESVTK
jgi:hypothetical protein